jgi:hypothetical protein
MTHEQLVEKFRDCARYAARPIPQQILEQVTDAVDHLEDLDDVGVIPALLTNL